MLHPGLRPLYAGHRHYDADTSTNGSRTTIDNPLDLPSSSEKGAGLQHQRAPSFKVNWTSSHRTIDDAIVAHLDAVPNTSTFVPLTRRNDPAVAVTAVHRACPDTENNVVPSISMRPTGQCLVYPY